MTSVSARRKLFSRFTIWCRETVHAIERVKAILSAALGSRVIGTYNFLLTRQCLSADLVRFIELRLKTGNARQCLRLVFTQHSLPRPLMLVEASLPPSRTYVDFSVQMQGSYAGQCGRMRFVRFRLPQPECLSVYLFPLLVLATTPQYRRQVVHAL